MAYGNYEGKEMSHPELRKYFEREYVINSDWYKDRLELKQTKDVNFYTQQINYLEDFIGNPDNLSLVTEMNIINKLKNVKKLAKQASSDKYIESLIGTIGADPLYTN